MPWSGEGAIFGDVADQERRDVLPLRREQQLGRRLPHLPMLPGADWASGEHRLDRSTI